MKPMCKSLMLATTLLAVPGLVLLLWLWRIAQKETPPSTRKEG